MIYNHVLFLCGVWGRAFVSFQREISSNCQWCFWILESGRLAEERVFANEEETKTFLSAMVKIEEN